MGEKIMVLDITDVLDSLKCNLADGQKHDVAEVS